MEKVDELIKFVKYGAKAVRVVLLFGVIAHLCLSITTLKRLVVCLRRWFLTGFSSVTLATLKHNSGSL